MREYRAKRRIAATISGALVLALALVGCGADSHVELDLPQQTDVALPQETVQQLQDAVTHAMAATGSPGAIVGVWAPWSGSWVTGLGTQYPGSAEEVTADMQFRAGKTTRAMTCDVMYAVAAEGKLSPDDRVSQYVAGVPDLSDVTLENLCDSTSGIGSYADRLMPMWLANPARTWNPREMASFGLGQERSSEPGAQYRDSDAGYVLLGLALQRATGQSARSLIEKYVTEPLDLAATRLGSTTGDDVLHGLLSMPIEGGVNCAEPLDITELSASTGFTDAGVVSDISDLGRYAQALASGALVPADVDRFADAKPPRPDAPSWFTIGGGAVQAGSLVGQFGFVPGYASAAFSDATTGLTVAVVLNNSAGGGDPAGNLAWELAAIASKAPAASGESAPEAGLPWTAEQFHAEIAARAICPVA